MKVYNTRVAPSPTGHFHLGTARTAYHNWLAARATGGKFILRIDDTDQNRNNDDYVDLIYTALDWLGIDFDDTFKQSARLDHYKDVAHQLMSKNLAIQDGDAIRLNADFVLDGWNNFYGKRIPITDKDSDFSKNLVLIKSDGYPTYNFSSIVDDIDSGINLVIRGSDHISNTSKQMFVLQALNNIDYAGSSDNAIDFCHVGLIMVKDPDTGKQVKLSKRNSASNLMDYKDAGFVPDAILNTVLKLGWAHKDANFDRDFPVIDKDTAKKYFFDGNLKTTNCSFDPNKLKFLNKKFKARV